MAINNTKSHLFLIVTLSIAAFFISFLDPLHSESKNKNDMITHSSKLKEEQKMPMNQLSSSLPNFFEIIISNRIIEGAPVSWAYSLQKRDEHIWLNYTQSRDGELKGESIARREKITTEEFTKFYKKLKDLKIFEKDYSKKEEMHGSNECSISITLETKKIIKYENITGASDEGGKLFTFLWEELEKFGLSKPDYWKVSK